MSESLGTRVMRGIVPGDRSLVGVREWSNVVDRPRFGRAVEELAR